MSNESLRKLTDKLYSETENTMEKKSCVDQTVEDKFNLLLKSSVTRRKEYSIKYPSNEEEESKFIPYEKTYIDGLEEGLKTRFVSLIVEEFGYLYYPGLTSHNGVYFSEVDRNLNNVRYYLIKNNLLAELEEKEDEISLNEAINNFKSRVRSVFNKK